MVETRGAAAKMRSVAEYRKLSGREQWYVELYLDGAVRVPGVGVRTFCDKVWAYVMAYGYEWRKAFDVKLQVFDGAAWVAVDEWCDGAKVAITIRDLAEWKKLKRRAEATYAKCQSAINAIRAEQFREDDTNFTNELKAAIADSALHGATEKDRNENRKMAMKFTGMDQVKIDVGVDMYSTIGKNLLQGLKGGADIDIPVGVDEYADGDDGGDDDK